MIKSRMISAYTPSNTAPEVLERIFVQRRRLLNHIVSRLSASMFSGDKHHILLVGPRGSGKTHLVSLAVWELKRTPELADSMRIAWLGEDDVFSGLIHLAFAIAKALADEYPDEFPADFKSSVRGLPPDDAALAILNAVLKNLGQRHLLIVTENLDQTFDSLGEMGQKKLRAFLQETRRIATLATSQQLFAGVSSRKEAFYGFFDPHHLEPLAIDDAQQLMRKIAAEQDKLELVRFLDSDSARYRVRALHHLAGGNYRMYVMLSEFLTKDTLDDLVASFEALAEAMTPYFQERFRALPDQERQLLQHLCDAEGARTVKEIAEETFIPQGNCSKQLGNLKSKGYVRSERRGKESYYDVAEPLMRLCLEVKSQRGRPLKLVARFLKAWFPEEMLQAFTNQEDKDSRVAEYCDSAIRLKNSLAAAVNANLTREIKEKFLEGEFLKVLELTSELEISDRVTAQKYRLMAARKSDNTELTIQTANELLRGDDARTELRELAYLTLVMMHKRRGDLHAALHELNSLVSIENSNNELKTAAILERGKIYLEFNNFTSAIEDFTTVIESPLSPIENRVFSLLLRASTFQRTGSADRAVSDCSEIVSLPSVASEHRAAAYLLRAFAYGALRENRKAIHDLSTVLEHAGTPIELTSEALAFRGSYNLHLGDAESSLSDFSAVLELPSAPADARSLALMGRGTAHKQNKNWLECLSDYDTLLSLPSDPLSLRDEVLFAVVEPTLALYPLAQAVERLRNAFENGNKNSGSYGGAPFDLLALILNRGPSEWAQYASAIAALYIQYGAAAKLGQGVTKSIELLDAGDFSTTQLEQWNQAWWVAGKGCEDLQLPLECLDAAVEVLKSDTPNDRPLFRLPLEIRQLVRPLLRKTLAES